MVISEKEKKELKKIRMENNDPKDEAKIVPLVENEIRIKNKKTKKIKTSIQYKVVIPKKFVDILKLAKTKNKAKFILHKSERKLTMEIIDD